MPVQPAIRASAAQRLAALSNQVYSSDAGLNATPRTCGLARSEAVWGSPEKVDTVDLLPGWLSACAVVDG